MIGTTAFSALRSCQARRQGIFVPGGGAVAVDQTGTTTIRGARFSVKAIPALASVSRTLSGRKLMVSLPM